jgi:AmmeMemoRadiSam system protein B
MDFPKLRYLESFPVSSQGGNYVCLRDPLNMTDKVVFLPLGAFFAVSLFDGKHSIRDIQAAFWKRFGQLLYTEKIEEMIKQLDANLFLDSERFGQHKSNLEKAFANCPTRPAAHAGTSYPIDPAELRDTLAAHFEKVRRQGDLPEQQEGMAVALIAPHIDLRVGGTCYAWVYDQIRDADFDLFVILGTAHAETRHFFAATFKDYETPLGVVKTNRSLLEKLKQHYGDRLFEDEFVHKQEHSIEFQTVFLKYILADRGEFEILPILCGSFHRMIQERQSPHEVGEFQSFVDSLKELLRDSGRRICLIAGADLAHIGLRFGDPSPTDELELQKLKREDEAKLRFVTQRDPEGFWDSIAQDLDRRRICGFPCIYTLLNLMEAREGRLLKYDQMDDRNTGSAVSYASVVFH